MGAHQQADGQSASIFQRFFHSEVSGSILLLGSAVVALVWANSPWHASYESLSHTKIGFGWGEHVHAMTLHHWINDGLMAIFFFVVGLEIKRELVVGEPILAEFSQRHRHAGDYSRVDSTPGPLLLSNLASGRRVPAAILVPRPRYSLQPLLQTNG